MNFIKKLKHPKELMESIMFRFPQLCSDKLYIQIVWKRTMGYPLNLKSPQTFNEKLQWLKLYDHNPNYTKMVDKYEAKKYVADIIGEEYIIPTLGVYNRVEDINFDNLPNQFVLKCTHDSGGLIVCRNKKELDIEATKKKLHASLKNNFYLAGREWPYKNVQPRIIAEQYVEDSQYNELRDYKFFCFDGVVKALFIASDRLKKDDETKFDFFDAEFNHLDIRNGHPNSEVTPAKPQTFEVMKQLAEKLSKGIPHVRVDFYEVDGKTYFGELTFYHWSGFVKFDPEKWDMEFGNWIHLPNKKE